jgi:hypothetical protein
MADGTEQIVAVRDQSICVTPLGFEHSVRVVAREREQLDDGLPASRELVEDLGIGVRVFRGEDIVGRRALANDLLACLVRHVRVAKRVVLAPPSELQHPLRSVARATDDVLGGFAKRGLSFEYFVVGAIALEAECFVGDGP